MLSCDSAPLLARGGQEIGHHKICHVSAELLADCFIGSEMLSGIDPAQERLLRSGRECRE
jgi:hypothetical protein